MKLFHLSDLHIGLKLMNRDLLEDQHHIFEQIVEQAKAERPDALLIAGDIYDKAIPSAEAMSLFDRFISDLRMAVPECEIMMISGNHDSAPRVNVYRNILSGQRIHMIGVPPEKEGDRIEQVTLEDEHGPVHFYLLPFVKPSMVRNVVGTEEDGSAVSYTEAVRRLLDVEDIDTHERNVIVSHQFFLPSGQDASSVARMDNERITVGNIDAIPASLLDPFDYAALGHIHQPMRVGRDTVRYCGTPLACSVSEAGQQKATLMIDMGAKGDIKVSELPLVPLRQVRILEGTLEELEQQATDDYVTVILTEEADALYHDVMQRLYRAFPHLLEVRRKSQLQARYREEGVGEAKELDPFELCKSFLSEIDEETTELLQDVINTIQGGM